MSTAYSGDGITFPDNSVQATAPRVGMVNRIINGDFNVWQRGTSFPAIVNGGYFTDRWRVSHTRQELVVNASREEDAPTATQAGIFTQYCMSLTATTVETTVDATDVFSFLQYVEGINAASFGFGQAGSRNLTLSFWVKGTKTGIHCVAIRNSAFNRSYVAEYTIATSNTWEYKAITIPVDTEGTWLYDTGRGFGLDFTLMSGTSRQTTANTWAAGSFVATANQVNALDSTSNVFKIALVQLEKGSTATDFEYVDYGRQLQMCQRYYQSINFSEAQGAYTKFGTGGSLGTTQARVNTHLVVKMRTYPSLVVTSTAADYGIGFSTNLACSVVPTINPNSSPLIATIELTVSSGLSANIAIIAQAHNNQTAYVGFNAEL
jgi:hypothetical protein